MIKFRKVSLIIASVLFLNGCVLTEKSIYSKQHLGMIKSRYSYDNTLWSYKQNKLISQSYKIAETDEFKALTDCFENYIKVFNKIQSNMKYTTDDKKELLHWRFKIRQLQEFINEKYFSNNEIKLHVI